MTLGIMTLSKMTLSTTTFSIMTLSIMTPSITTFSIMTLAQTIRIIKFSITIGQIATLSTKAAKVRHRSNTLAYYEH